MNPFIITGIIWFVFVILFLGVDSWLYHYAKGTNIEIKLSIETNHWWYVTANVFIWFAAVWFTLHLNLPLVIAVMVFALLWTEGNNYIALLRVKRTDRTKWSLIK